MIGRLALVFALLTASPALAQEAPSAEVIAEAKAHADLVIERSDAKGAFVNITTTDAPMARHVASGLTCIFNVGDDRDNIHFYPEIPGGPVRGDDVSCGSWWGSTYVTVIATRYRERYSAEDLFSSAVLEIRSNWQNVSPIDREFSGVMFTGQEQPLVGLFHAEREGRKRQTAVVMRNIDDWSFKTRATGEPDDENLPRMATAAFAVSLPGGWEAFLAQ